MKESALPAKSPLWRDALWLAAAAFAYFVAARLGLALALQPGAVASVWLPEGIFLSAILLTRRRLRPLLVGVFCVTGFVADLLAGTPVLVGAIYALILSLDATLSAWLLGRFVGEPLAFQKSRELVGFLVLAIFLSNFASGLAAAAASRLIPGTSFWRSWVGWVSSNGMGNLLVTPFLLSWAAGLRTGLGRWKAKRVLEASALFLALGFLNLLTFGYLPNTGLFSLLLPFSTFPLLIWIALRFGMRGVTSALGLLALIVVAFAASGRLSGLFGYGFALPEVIVVQFYLAIMAIPVLFLAVVVTERAQGLDALREREARLNKAEEIAQVGSWEMELASGRLSWSEEVYRLFGLSPGEFGASYPAFLEAVHPEDRAAVDAAYRGSLREGRDAYEIEHRVVRRDTGEIRQVREKCEHLRDASGRVVRSIGMVHDITERKRAEGAFRELSRKNEEALRVAQMGHWEFDLASGLFTFNDQYYTLHGITAREAGGYQMSAEQFARRYVHPEDSHLVQEAIAKAVAAEDAGFQLQLDARILRADGEARMVTVWFRIQKDERNLTVKLHGVNQDISERRRAEETLRVRNRYIDTVLANAPIGFAVNTIHDGKVVFVGDKFEELYGVPRGSLRGVEDFFAKVYRDAEFREKIRARILADIASGDAARMRWEDIPLLEASGEKRYITAINIPVLDQDLMVSTVQDVTARHRAEERLQESEQRFRLLVEQAADGFELTDAEGRLIDVNGATCRQLGYSKEELLRLGVKDIDPVVSRETYAARFQELVNGDSLIFETTHRRRDGTTFPVEINTSVIRLGDELRALTLVRDISDRKREEQEREKLQGQLAQAQKMESIGRLAGGVAHDFNNMLEVILGNTELALNGLPASSALREGLQEVAAAAQRSAELTRQLLAFARKQTIAPRVLDLNEAVGGILSMLRRLIGEDIDLAWIPGAGLWKVKVDAAQIDQVLANLCINARDAIAGVGRVTIETAKAAFDQAYCAHHPGFTPGQYVLLAVSDDGRGMSKEVLEHLFEPFFTTKELGKGTGLGLATVYGIVRQNEGFINVYSEPGRGTSFKIYLPRHANGPEAGAEAEQSKAPPRGTETVLLVEDEKMILKLGTSILGFLGYQVLAAPTPGEALALAARHQGPIHLLITDVVMPEMSGKELSEKLAVLRPETRVLFTSGYTANTIAHHGVLEEGVQFLQKPFSISGLATKVREILDRPAGGGQGPGRNPPPAGSTGPAAPGSSGGAPSG